jgi:hypothetical protein|tara:strand:- start:1269 stop:1397 length:129 start_codon:yes stop_codon:yes gene_type:complete
MSYDETPQLIIWLRKQKKEDLVRIAYQLHLEKLNLKALLEGE